MRPLIGCRLDLTDAPTPARLPDRPRRLWPAVAAAEPGQDARGKRRVRAVALPTSRRIRRASPSSPGQRTISMISNGVAAASRRLAVTSPCRGELALSRRRRGADRTARPAGAGERLHDPRHQRRPLPRARAAAAAGRRHLHPREGDDRHGRIPAQPQCRAAFEVAGGDGRGCSRAGRMRSRRRASSPTRFTSASTSCATNIRARRCPKGARRSSIWSI